MPLTRRGSFNVEFKYEGNWLNFNQVVRSSDISLVIAARTGQKNFAIEYRDNVKENILTGGRRFGYPPHSPKYLYNKLTKGGPGDLLVWSRAFYGAVEIKENRRQTRYSVGIESGIKRPTYHRSDRNKLTIAEYANVLEHGTNNMPARPVFSDTFSKQMQGKAGLKKYLELALVTSFAAKGVRVRKGLSYE